MCLKCDFFFFFSLEEGEPLSGNNSFYCTPVSHPQAMQEIAHTRQSTNTDTRRYVYIEQKPLVLMGILSHE